MADIDLDANADSTGKGQKTVKYWMGEVGEALKREKDWRKEAREVVKLYEADKEGEDSFNILYSNTETLAPALMNSTPRPRVKRRFLDEDKTGKEAANIVQRLLEFLLDTDQREYTPFEDLMSEAILGSLVPGRGVTRFKYDADISHTPASGEEGTEGYVPAGESLDYETVCGDSVPWNRFLYGYAKKWQNVPWIGFEWPMSVSELKKNFGDEVVARMELGDIEGENDGTDKDQGNRASETSTKGAWVYEIWDKESRKVLFVTECYKDGVLKEVDDPLQLTGFFPCPEPLRFTRRLDSQCPISMYKYYESQAKELNRVSVRINKIISALKVRGFYDSTLEGMDTLLSAADNTLVPIENVAALQQGQTLERSISLLPIEKLIAVLQQLYIQRQQVKQVIYEITGIADIMRGSTQASETLGAQQIKNQWGTLRLKSSQTRVQRYVRECLRIMAEIAVTKLSPETISAMTGIVLPTAQMKEQAKMQLELMSQQAQMSGQPPPPPPPQLEELFATPTVEEVTQLLQNDLLRSYRIDIETDSTIEQEVSEDKQDMSEMMNALGQFLNGIGPLVTEGIIPFEVAKAMLMGIVRRFRFGGDVEDLLVKMQPPQPKQEETDPKNSPEVIQAQTQATLAIEQSKQATLKMDMEGKAAEHQARMAEITRKSQAEQLSHAARLVQIQADMAKAEQNLRIAKETPKPAGVKSSNTRGK